MYNYYPSYLFQEKKLYCLPPSKEQGNSPPSLQSRAIFALLFAARIDQNISSPCFYGVIISMAQWVKLGVYLIYNFLWNNKTKTNCQKNFLTYKVTYFFFGWGGLMYKQKLICLFSLTPTPPTHNLNVLQ